MVTIIIYHNYIYINIYMAYREIVFLHILYCKYFQMEQNKNNFLPYHIGFGVKCDLDISGPFFMSFYSVPIISLEGIRDDNMKSQTYFVKNALQRHFIKIVNSTAKPNTRTTSDPLERSHVTRRCADSHLTRPMLVIGPNWQQSRFSGFHTSV